MHTDEKNNDTGHRTGLLDSVKNFAATLLAIGQTRLELLSTELEEERERLSSMLVWTLITFFCAVLAVVLATLLIVVIFWDTNRLTALGILLGIFILATGLAWRVVYNMSKIKPRLFSATLNEISRDREQLDVRNE